MLGPARSFLVNAESYINQYTDTVTTVLSLLDVIDDDTPILFYFMASKNDPSIIENRYKNDIDDNKKYNYYLPKTPDEAVNILHELSGFDKQEIKNRILWCNYDYNKKTSKENNEALIEKRKEYSYRYKINGTTYDCFDVPKMFQIYFSSAKNNWLSKPKNDIRELFLYASELYSYLRLEYLCCSIHHFTSYLGFKEKYQSMSPEYIEETQFSVDLLTLNNADIDLNYVSYNGNQERLSKINLLIDLSEAEYRQEAEEFSIVFCDICELWHQELEKAGLAMSGTPMPQKRNTALLVLAEALGLDLIITVAYNGVPFDDLIDEEDK